MSVVYERIRQAVAPAGGDPRLDNFVGFSLHLAAESLLLLAPSSAQQVAIDKVVELAEFVAGNWNAIPDPEPEPFFAPLLAPLPSSAVSEVSPPTPPEPPSVSLETAPAEATGPTPAEAIPAVG